VRSHTEGRRRVATAAALVVAALSLAAAPVRRESAQFNTGTPDQVEIEHALDRVKADPNLATERTINTLRWKESGEKKPSRTPAWLMWLIGLFGWVDQSARILVWAGATVLAGLLVVYIVRMVRTSGGNLARRGESFIAPTHVRDLDIRPETLPLNVGPAARALWDRGEHRASLALLYRGMLSRLAHVHGVPIRDSSTEGDCLALAASRLPQGKCEYLSRLVRVWQYFGYGHENVQAAVVYGLCDDFAFVLDSAASHDSISTQGAA
jgi:hypothetical protein